MKDIVVTVLNVADETATGDGGFVDTIGARDHVDSSAFFYLNCTSLTGTSPTMDVTIVASLSGTEFTVGTFTQLTAASTEKIEVTGCPSSIKVVYTAGGTVTDFDCTVTSVRF